MYEGTAVRKEYNMLREWNERRVLFVFFAVTLFIIGHIVIIDRDALDFLYFVVIICYFIRFIFDKK